MTLVETKNIRIVDGDHVAVRDGVILLVRLADEIHTKRTHPFEVH